MDYAAEMLLRHVRAERFDQFDAVSVKPHYFGAFERLRMIPPGLAWNLDRLVTRFITYPVQLAAVVRRFDLFHVVDHTYAHLIHALPRGRTGVFCHDLDAFEPVLDQSRQFAWWRSQMASTLLSGLRRAAVVFYSTEQIRERILRHGLIDERRLVHAPYGVADEFWRASEDAIPKVVRGLPYLLNVAGNFPRKRLDLLFKLFARLRTQWPELRLVQHGAELTEGQRRDLDALGIANHLVQTDRLSRAELAALYSKARLVVLPSEREGFGFPVVEAFAAGAIVVLSDIPAFREVAGEAGVFCRVGDLDEWEATVSSLLQGSRLPPSAELRRARAQLFSWSRHAQVVSEAYAALRQPT
jgi:glycosyltransferase involved in cell wall biosynthesis